MERSSGVCTLQKPLLVASEKLANHNFLGAGCRTVTSACFCIHPARSVPKRHALSARDRDLRVAIASVCPSGTKGFKLGSPAGTTSPIAAEHGIRSAQSDSASTAKDETSTPMADGDEGISDAEVQASMAAAAGLLGVQDASKKWSIKDEVEGMTDEPVYVPKTPKEVPKTPKEVIYDLLFLLGGLLDRPIPEGGPTMAAAGEVVVERIQDELKKAGDAGATNDQVTELGRYVNLLATDLKLVGAARKSDTLATRCQAAQDKIKSAMQRVEALEEDQAGSA